MKNLPESNDPTRVPVATSTISVEHGFHYNPEFIRQLSKRELFALVQHEKGHLRLIADRMRPSVYQKTLDELNRLESNSYVVEDFVINLPDSGRS